MRIVLLVARETVEGCALEHGVHMARFASHLHVSAVQFKNGTVVIEGRWFPSIRRMARGTFRAQAPSMCVIFCVARKTILAGQLQGRKMSRHHMALGTLYKRMFAVQLKSEFVVIEIVSESFHPVVTLKTTLAKRNLMFHHECHILEDVTFAAGQFVELGNILAMAIGTQERFLLSREWVAV
mgnify:CR=1 FL=1